MRKYSKKLLDYNQLKEEINKFNLDLKNNLIEHYTKKIKEIENIYENNKKINDNLEILTNNLISNYSLNEKHNSNISNILYPIVMPLFKLYLTSLFKSRIIGAKLVGPESLICVMNFLYSTKTLSIKCILGSL